MYYYLINSLKGVTKRDTRSIDHSSYVVIYGLGFTLIPLLRKIFESRGLSKLRDVVFCAVGVRLLRVLIPTFQNCQTARAR